MIDLTSVILCQTMWANFVNLVRFRQIWLLIQLVWILIEL